MKRLTVFVMMLVMLVSACQNNGSVSEESNNKTDNEINQNNDKFSIGDTVHLEGRGEYEATIENVYQIDGEVIRIDVNINNINDSNTTTNNLERIRLKYGEDGHSDTLRDITGHDNHFPTGQQEEIMKSESDYNFYLEFNDSVKSVNDFYLEFFSGYDNQVSIYFHRDDMQVK